MGKIQNLSMPCTAMLCTPRIHKIPFEKFMHGLGKKVIENFIAEQNVGRCVESEWNKPHEFTDARLCISHGCTFCSLNVPIMH